MPAKRRRKQQRRRFSWMKTANRWALWMRWSAAVRSVCRGFRSYWKMSTSVTANCRGQACLTNRLLWRNKALPFHRAWRNPLSKIWSRWNAIRKPPRISCLMASLWQRERCWKTLNLPAPYACWRKKAARRFIKGRRRRILSVLLPVLWIIPAKSAWRIWKTTALSSANRFARCIVNTKSAAWVRQVRARLLWARFWVSCKIKIWRRWARKISTVGAG